MYIPTDCNLFGHASGGAFSGGTWLIPRRLQRQTYLIDLLSVGPGIDTSDQTLVTQHALIHGEIWPTCCTEAGQNLATCGDLALGHTHSPGNQKWHGAHLLQAGQWHCLNQIYPIAWHAGSPRPGQVGWTERAQQIGPILSLQLNEASYLCVWPAGACAKLHYSGVDCLSAECVTQWQGPL